MKKLLTLVFASLLVAVSFSSANAQNKITEEKRALIAEFITLTKMEQQANQMIDAMMESFEVSYPRTVKEILGRSPSSGPADAKLEKEMIDKAQSASRKFRERWKQYVNIKEYIEVAAYQLYDKYFTEDDLRTLNAFYRTAAAQKFIEISPEMMKESMVIAGDMLLPQVRKLSEDIIKEEIDRLKTTSQKSRKEKK